MPEFEKCTLLQTSILQLMKKLTLYRTVFIKDIIKLLMIKPGKLILEYKHKK